MFTVIGDNTKRSEILMPLGKWIDCKRVCIGTYYDSSIQYCFQSTMERMNNQQNDEQSW